MKPIHVYMHVVMLCTCARAYSYQAIVTSYEKLREDVDKEAIRVLVTVGPPRRKRCQR